VSAGPGEPRWAELTVRVPAAWAPIDPARLGIADLVWTQMGVPLPPLVVTVDDGAAAGAVSVWRGEESLATATGEDAATAIVRAVLAAAPRWITPALAGALLDLSVPLETLERFTAVTPREVQAALLGRLVADQVDLRNLALVAETCLAVELELRLGGTDVAGLAGDVWLNVLELASRVALRRAISLQLLGQSRTHLVMVPPEVTERLASHAMPVEALVAAIERAGGKQPTAAIVVLGSQRRPLRDLIVAALPGVPVVSLEELIASPAWDVVTIEAP
jgi:hypothetical protein